MAIESGTILRGYEVVAPLGAGGMGEVYRARDIKLGREVAIKVLPDGFSDDPEAMARLAREARVLASLNHPNIATLYGFEVEGDTQFLVMELVEGWTLAERISRGPIPIDEALPLFLQIAEGIEAAHEKGVIHRDLKPANIKIIRDRRVKILDFGLAMALAWEADAAADAPLPAPEDSSGASDEPKTESHEGRLDSSSPPSGLMPTGVTRTGTVLGTPGYMSPEQAQGELVGKPSDIWAFGCCLFEALTGKRAFEGETAQEALARVLVGQPDWVHLDDVPTVVRDLVHHCLARNPDERTRNFGEAASLLRAAISERPDTQPSGPPPRLPSLEEKLFDLSQDMLCIAGMDGFFKRVNPAYERTLGWSAEELYSRPFIDFIHPDDRSATNSEMVRIGKGIPTISFSNRYRCPDGTYRRLHWTAQLEEGTGLIYAVARASPLHEGSDRARSPAEEYGRRRAKPGEMTSS